MRTSKRTKHGFFSVNEMSPKIKDKWSAHSQNWLMEKALSVTTTPEQQLAHTYVNAEVLTASFFSFLVQ